MHICPAPHPRNRTENWIKSNSVSARGRDGLCRRNRPRADAWGYMERDILRVMVRKTLLAGLAALTAAFAAGKIERRLYVTDKTGISVYDIDSGHTLVRKIELPGTGDYKGIAASPILRTS